ncbi:MAG: CoA protein activase [Clostridiales bacterium]|nr:CoA protein activase [Clostridiales bacterium]MCF8023322.1 CoA protein activase [Clostridiales bacterium]
MRITFPHMGYMWVCVEAMLSYLGVDVCVPPLSTKRTLDLGSKYSAEFICMPLKINLGNFIEAAEKGADTIAMAGGKGPCRFGYYAQIEHAILQELGYDYKLVVLEPPERHIFELLNKIRYISGNSSWRKIYKGIKFGFLKARAVDKLEEKAHWLRPREIKHKSTDKAFNQALQQIIKVKTPEEMPAAEENALNIMEQVSVDEQKPVVKVGIIGEIYTLLDPFSNHDLEKQLGYLGVEVERSLYLSEWINDHLLMGFVKDMPSHKDMVKYAYPYTKDVVGGHTREGIGAAVKFAEQGFSGIIHILPFTCMPEIVTMSILPELSKDKDIPVMTLIMDEQTGRAGVTTRLEAFADLIKRKKAAQQNII